MKSNVTQSQVGIDTEFYVNTEGELVPVPTEEFANPYHDKGGRFTGPNGGSGGAAPALAPIGFRELKDKAKAAASAVGEAAGNAAQAVNDATIGNLKEWKADDFGGDEGSFRDKVSGLIDHTDGLGEKLKGLVEKAKPDPELLSNFHDSLDTVGMYSKGFYQYTKDHDDEATNFIADNGNDMSTALSVLGKVTGIIGAHVAAAHPPVGASIIAVGGGIYAASAGLSYATKAAQVNQARLGGEPGAASISAQIMEKIAARHAGSDAVAASLSPSEYYELWATNAGIDIDDASPADLKTVMSNRVSELFMIVEDSQGEGVVPRFCRFQLAEPVLASGNPNHGADGRFTSGPGGKGGLGLAPVGGFSWKTAVGITKARTKIAHATGIPTTKSGFVRKRNAVIVHNEGKIVGASIAVGAVAVGALLHDHYEQKIKDLEGKVSEAETKAKTADTNAKASAEGEVKRVKDELAKAQEELKQAKSDNGEAARERQPGESFKDYMKRLAGK